MSALISFILILSVEQTFSAREVQANVNSETHKQELNLLPNPFFDEHQEHVQTYSDGTVAMQEFGGVARIKEPFSISSKKEIQFYHVKLNKLGRSGMFGKAAKALQRRSEPVSFEYGFQDQIKKTVEFRIVHTNDGFIHIDNKHKKNGQKEAKVEIKNKFGKGDTLGCGILMNAGKNGKTNYIFYTKKSKITGKDEPIASFELPDTLNHISLYPYVSMHQENNAEDDGFLNKKGQGENCLKMQLKVESLSADAITKVKKFAEQHSSKVLEDSEKH